MALLGSLLHLIILAEFIPSPYCDSDVESCPWCYTRCPLNGNCSKGIFQGCVEGAIQVNGTKAFFCILPNTDDAQALSITNNITALLKKMPVLLSIDRLAQHTQEPHELAILARAVNFTGTHKVDATGEISRQQSVWNVVSQFCGLLGIANILRLAQ
jgi:hypothetical protein